MEVCYTNKSAWSVLQTWDVPGVPTLEDCPDGYLVCYMPSQQDPTRIDKQYKCLYCSHVTRWIRNMKRHIQIHRGENITCSLCDAHYFSKTALRHHLKHKHKLGRRCVCRCALCGTRFNDTGDLKRHAETEHNISFLDTKIDVYQCGQCDRVFPVPSSLFGHFNSHGDVTDLIEDSSETNN